MLKKSIAILLSVSILCCFCACTQTPEDTTTDTTSENQLETTQNSGSTPDIYIDNNVDVENKIENDNNTTKQKNTTKYTQPNNQKQTTKKSTTTNRQTTHSYQTKHSHSFSSANCTTPKKCYCGATSGSALGHSYSAATCFSPKTCNRCGATSGSALGHNYKNNKCTRCGKTDPNLLPVGLDKLTVIDQNNYTYQNKPFIDSFGNTYNGVHFYEDTFSSTYSMHNLNGQFETFTGSIVASPETEPGRSFSIGIYVDDELKYSKTGFSKITGKIDFSISVKNGKILTIKVSTEQNGATWHEEVGIVNATLSK